MMTSRKPRGASWLKNSLVIAYCASGHAYEPANHSAMSVEALRKSVLVSNAGKLRGFGLKPSVASSGDNFPNSEGTNKLTIEELVGFGAAWEDDRGILQAPRHFYNPVDGSKLLPLIGETSPDWALEDRGVKDAQPYSYRLMRRNFHKALTAPLKADRDIAWGLTFQTLGHVMHHLQDMAQPQHVRGDAHCDAPAPCLIPGITLGYYSPSIYEKRIEARPPDFGNYAPVYIDARSSSFTNPRKFWHTNPPGGQETGRGIAEFTNRSFISSGTNFDKGTINTLPRFDPAIVEEVDIKALCAASPGSCATPSLFGTIRFFGNQFIDPNTGETIVNRRMTTNSVFDSALSRRVVGPVFSYNKFNADSAAAILIPRAVGYSAGMINYFFRGDIDMAADPDVPGTYMIQNKGLEPLTGAFRLYYDDINDNRIPLRLWNLTIPPNGKVNVGELAPPVEPVPKKRDEYMLVFTGDMGEETRQMFETGAVTGAVVDLRPGNTLYLAGLDASNQLVLMKTDRSGTQVLNGNEFHPLREMYASSKAVRAKTYLSKQAAFTNDGESYSIRSVVVGDAKFPIASTTYSFFNGTPRDYRDYLVGSNRFNWQARAHAVDGERVLAFTLQPTTETSGSLYYDSYLIVDGSPQMMGRTFVTIPPLPGNPVTIVSLLDVGRGKFLVSPEGERLIGLIARGTAIGQRDHFELQLTLGETVAARWVKTRSDTTSSTGTTNPSTATQLATRKVLSPLVCGSDSPIEFEVKTIREVAGDNFLNSANESAFLDFQKGQLIRIDYEKKVVSTASFDQTV